MKETEEEIEGSAWPFVIIGLIIGLIIGGLGGFFLKPTPQALITHVNAPKVAPSKKIQIDYRAFESENNKKELKELKFYVSNLEKNISLLKEEGAEKKKPRTQLVYKGGIQDNTISEHITSVITNSKDIIWISNTPLDIQMLQACRRAKELGKSVSIICGSNALDSNIQAAIRSNLSVYQVSAWVGENTQILILDSKKIIDFSNENAVLESQEELVLENTLNWYEAMTNLGLKRK